MSEVEYKYALSCEGALSERIECESDGSTVKSWLRYQYHGLNLLRIDEKWDSDNDADIDANDLWRVMNLYVHGPGQIGQTVRTWRLRDGMDIAGTFVRQTGDQATVRTTSGSETRLEAGDLSTEDLRYLKNVRDAVNEFRTWRLECVPNLRR